MLYKSAETCHPVSLQCKGTNIRIFVTCGASFHLQVWSVLCTTTDTISIPMGAMYLHARIFFTQADITSILMFAMYLHARMFCTLAPYVFYSHGCNVRAWNLFWASVAKLVSGQLMILLPCTLSHMSSIQMSAINFYMPEHFLHSLIRLLFSCLRCIHMQECSVH